MLNRGFAQQKTVTADATNAAKEPPIELAPFEVRTEKDVGVASIIEISTLQGWIDPRLPAE